MNQGRIDHSVGELEEKIVCALRICVLCFLVEERSVRPW